MLDLRDELERGGKVGRFENDVVALCVIHSSFSVSSSEYICRKELIPFLSSLLSLQCEEEKEREREKMSSEEALYRE